MGMKQLNMGKQQGALAKEQGVLGKQQTDIANKQADLKSLRSEGAKLSGDELKQFNAEYSSRKASLKAVVDALQRIAAGPHPLLIGFHLLHGGVVLRPDEIPDGTDDAAYPLPELGHGLPHDSVALGLSPQSAGLCIQRLHLRLHIRHISLQRRLPA